MSKLVIAFSTSLPNLVGAQQLKEDSGFGEPTLRKMYCSSNKSSCACKYQSEGEDCPLTHTTNCH